VFTQPWPAGPSSKRRDQWIYYQYRADRARRALRGIDEQVAKAAKAVAGLAPVKRTPVTADFVIGSYHELRNVEKSFRMAKSDLQAGPIYHRKRDSIEAHLMIVFAALAVSRWIEHQTGWSIRKFVKTARRYRTIQIQAGQHTVTAADPIPDDLRHALNAINAPAEVRKFVLSQVTRK
jgi:transposase